MEPRACLRGRGGSRVARFGGRSTTRLTIGTNEARARRVASGGFVGDAEELEESTPA